MKDQKDNKQLQQTIKFYGTLLRVSNDGILITDASQNIIEVNDTFCSFIGQNRRAVIESNLFMWLENFLDDAVEKWIHLERSVQSKQVVSNYEFQLSLNNEIRYLDVNASLLEKIKNEEQGIIISNWHDITERKQATETLRESEELHRITLSNISDAVFITDNKGVFTYICPNVDVIFGYSLNEVQAFGNISKLIGDDLFAPDELEVLGEIRNIEREITDKSRRTHSLLVNIKGVSIKGGTVLYTCRDITERRKEEEFIKSIFESINEGLVVTDREFRIITANKAYCDQMKKPIEDVIGRHCYEVSHHIDKPCYESGEGCPVKYTYATGQTHTYIHTHYDKEGIPVYVEVKSYPIKDTSGNVTSAIEIITDITKTVKLEEDLKKKIKELQGSEEKIKRDFHIQSAISSILRISLEPISLKEQLEHTLDLILSLPWLALLSKGCIYLVEDDPEVLVMQAQRGFSDVLLTTCARVPFGKCLCGRAASTRELVFADCVDGRHEVCYQGMLPHGHYCVPILSRGRLLGVICMYVVEGHRRDKEEEEFLSAVTHTLAGIIERKKAEEALQKARDELELRVKDRTTELRKAVEQLEREITDRRQAEEQIKASLEEKKVLLSEIHHRVKNNMQVISSLLDLQSDYIKDKQYINMFKDSQNRIKSMALIHEKLYQSKDLTNIDFIDYVGGLTFGLFRSYGVSASKVALKIDVKGVSLGIDTAIPCGLIINELVSNSLKYAFPEDTEGEIMVTLRSTEGDEIELIVCDNGVGIPKGLDFRNTESLGLQLVTNLIKHQLQGTTELIRDKGTKFQIQFKEKQYKKRV